MVSMFFFFKNPHGQGVLQAIVHDSHKGREIGSARWSVGLLPVALPQKDDHIGALSKWRPGRRHPGVDQQAPGVGIKGSRRWELVEMKTWWSLVTKFEMEEWNVGCGLQLRVRCALGSLEVWIDSDTLMFLHFKKLLLLLMMMMMTTMTLTTSTMTTIMIIPIYHRSTFIGTVQKSRPSSVNPNPAVASRVRLAHVEARQHYFSEQLQLLQAAAADAAAERRVQQHLVETSKRLEVMEVTGMGDAGAVFFF